ncbi:tannase and feruloyl esterase [Cryphonectria parasitica EP155]|uniref:Carboxylic ester hydrolase n=1 Tax=Cryphonectria parasitica (strain ATCC 38755 / EP155) TaxID=660469 RepID=A0A9P4Y5A9_CRYP1|nr:tannase and feruloyl esterase [Cryphonectria parasitica EP155]KAF3766978.1 tannase and feruloyl esterase [Cryphonectria parasitica EP155]
MRFNTSITSFHLLLFLFFFFLLLPDTVFAILDCANNTIPSPTVFGAQILSITAYPIDDWQDIPGNDICYVTISLTHPGAGDLVNNFFALPISTPWNRVFQGIGGGGYAAGTLTAGASQTAIGYSIGATDAGLPTSDPNSSQDASGWALVSPGNADQVLLLNFARRSVHDLAGLGRALSTSFYGGGNGSSSSSSERGPDRAYWNGCSTGGRQGLAAAQYYPADWDGVLADAPAIQWNDFTMAQQWPYTVQNNEGYVPQPCELAFVAAQVVEACDALDGLVDGIVSAPSLCTFTAQGLVGQRYTCASVNGSSSGMFSQRAADVVDKILDGPRTPEGEVLWYGLVKGANFSNTAPNIEGNETAQSFTVADSWIRGFIAKDLGFDTANVSYAEFADIFLQGHLQYDSIMGSASPDLAPFKRHGGKIITWQGLADGTINPQGTMFYYQKILAIDPSAANFYRQFYSPGVGHCGSGTGVIPTDAIGQLRAWVENGTAPDVLHAASTYPVNAFLDLCPWPSVNRYKGSGDPAEAASWECASGTGWVEFSGLHPENYSVVGGPGWYGSSFSAVEI